MTLPTKSIAWLTSMFVVLAAIATMATHCNASLKVTDLGKTYDFDPADSHPGLFHHIPRKNDVTGGNTSVRNEQSASLVWKGRPNSNGYGYFQRNRDLGQVFNVPEGKDVTVKAVILRTAKGDNALMAGALGAKVYLQFFRVNVENGKTLSINENGTTKGQKATHGFDLRLNRADDFIEGAIYEPIARFTGGVFPKVKPTTQYVYNRGNKQPFGEQPGHLRFFRLELTGSDQLTLNAGGRYAFLLGFENPGKSRGIGLACSTDVHAKEPAKFVRDQNGLVCWGIRREGNGVFQPTMIGGKQPPEDPALRMKLISESMFPVQHWDSIRPTSNGYPDVDTYRTLQFYLEVDR